MQSDSARCLSKDVATVWKLSKSSLPLVAIIDLLSNAVPMRTIYNTLLDFIKASAQIHQYQREKTADGKIIATWDDYFVSRITFMKTHGIGGIPFTKADNETEVMM